MFACIRSRYQIVRYISVHLRASVYHQHIRIEPFRHRLVASAMVEKYQPKHDQPFSLADAVDLDVGILSNGETT